MSGGHDSNGLPYLVGKYLVYEQPRPGPSRTRSPLNLRAISLTKIQEQQPHLGSYTRYRLKPRSGTRESPLLVFVSFHLFDGYGISSVPHFHTTSGRSKCNRWVQPNTCAPTERSCSSAICSGEGLQFSADQGQTY